MDNKTSNYVFISYAHKDKNIVLPIIDALQNAGIAVWYDKGIEAGSEWPEYIAGKLFECNSVIVMLSDNYVASQNCTRELNFAISENKPVLTIHLAGNIRMTLGVRMQLGTSQGMFRENFSSQNEFLNELTSARFFDDCRTGKVKREVVHTSADREDNPDDCFKKGQQYANEKDYINAVYWYRKAAEQGHAGAQCNLGVCYGKGQGVNKDLSQAVYWYKKSAEQGNKYAQNNLGDCYYDGSGVSQDYTQAVSWFRKSAEQGDAYAQYSLGYCCENGRGISKDLSQAICWYHSAAEQGYSDAQFKLGYCYQNGKGIDQDYVQATYWYKKAAEQGDLYSQYSLGDCYYYGNGVNKDMSQAIYWYKKSAEQGNAYSQFILGYCYEKGKGVNQDLLQAADYYEKAANQGDMEATKRLAKIRRKR